MTSKAIIELNNVSKEYEIGGDRVSALSGINLTVLEGQALCIKGASGSGKTTLLSIIGCIFSPSSGGAIVARKKISRLPDHFLTRYRRQLVGFVFQHYNLLEHLSVMENVTLPLVPLGVSPRMREIKALPLLERFGLLPRKNFKVKLLSGGEMQRTALVRALINDPPIFIADEPTAHLDPSLSGEVLSYFADLKGEGRTIVLSSHDPIVAKMGSIDFCIELSEGKII
jgi:putative ABC transport system ATP-binding protein